MDTDQFLYINCSKIESDQAKTKKYCKNIKNQLISADLCLKIDISFEMLIGSRIIDEIWKKMRGGTFIVKSASFTNSVRVDMTLTHHTSDRDFQGIS